MEVLQQQHINIYAGLEKVNQTINTLSGFDNTPVDFYWKVNGHLQKLQIRTFQYSDFMHNKPVVFGIWNCDGNEPVAFADIHFEHMQKTPTLHNTNLINGNIRSQLPDQFQKLVGILKKNSCPAFAVDKNYRRNGLAQLLYATCLYTLNSLGYQELRIRSDSTDRSDYTFINNLDPDLDAIGIINPSSLYTKYTQISSQTLNNYCIRDRMPSTFFVECAPSTYQLHLLREAFEFEPKEAIVEN